MATNMLGNLLNEFYHPTTPNDRKKQIESELLAYKSHPNSWQQSLCDLQNYGNFTSNQFVWFFNASTIECTITKRWLLLRPQDRSMIRDSLWRTYANLPINTTVPRRQRDTIAQLLALMGKHDFPDEHPDYMNNILELLKTNCILGIVLLRITSEEIVNPKDDVSFDRKKYFHSCVSLYLPEVMNIIEKILNSSICEMNSNTSLPIDDNQSGKLIELLSCVQHLFSWISLDLVSDTFLMNIFELSKWKDNCYEISISSISILNELFYVQRSIHLPDTIIQGINELLHQNNLSNANELYQDKFTELLRLYTNKYWSKLITNDNTNELFSNLIIALYEYTFNMNGYGGALAFTEKLEIWTPLLRGLILNDFLNGKYTDIMYSLINGILKKMQFRYDQEQELETLDNEILDDNNMETEWQHYLTQCIEIIALIAEGCSITVFEQVFIDWQHSFQLFITSLDKYFTNTNQINNHRNNTNDNINDDNNKIILITEQTKCHFIHCILRDLSSLCQTLVRLTAIIETTYENCIDKLIQIKQHLLYLLKFFDTKKFHCINIENSSILNSDISELHSQVILAIRSLLSCSTIFNNSETELKDLIEEIGKILLSSSSLSIIPQQQQQHHHHHHQSIQQYQHESTTKSLVMLAASQLLLRIATIIRPRFMLECPSISQLMQVGSNLSYLPKQIVIIIHQMIISCLVLPWPNVETINQSYEHRNNVLHDYVKCLTNDFLQINDDLIIDVNRHEIIAKVSMITISILPILKDVIEHFTDSSSAIKQMLLNNFKCVIAKSLSVYQIYGFTSFEVAESIFDFLLSVLRCLQVQLGTAFVQQMISIFLESFSKIQSDVYRLKVLEKILRMLILIVEQPGSSTMSLIPSILNLTIYHALPWLQDDKNSSNDSDAAYLLYSLFDVILQHRWQYFYKSQVLRGFSPGASDYVVPNDEHPQHADQLLAILTSYGRILVNGNDPHLNNIILTSLQNLNDKWKLYNRDFFKDNLLQSFQYAIINSLFSAEGAIYYDLLLNVLFSMGQVNKTKLHDAFISLGYKDSIVVNDICLATDLPTFSQKINQLIQDTRSMRLTQ